MQQMRGCVRSFWPITLSSKSQLHMLLSGRSVFFFFNLNVGVYMRLFVRICRSVRAVAAARFLIFRLIITAHAHFALHMHAAIKPPNPDGTQLGSGLFARCPFLPESAFFSGARRIVGHTTPELRVVVNAGIIACGPGLHTPLHTLDHSRASASRFQVPHGHRGRLILRRGQRPSFWWWRWWGC